MLENLAVASLAGEGADQRIVVVDDDPVLRAILRGYLEDARSRSTARARSLGSPRVAAEPASR